MVFFTCQNCNAALRKSDVEKHEVRSMKCVPLFLTCIDCLKDYRGDEYKEHTSCVSEEIRYGGKDATEKVKGVRQNKWLQVVEKVLENPHQPVDVRYIFKIIKGQPNIPRNKKKFHNYLKSKMNRNYNEKHADIVFSIFEKEEQEQKKILNTSNASQEKETEENNTDELNKKEKKKLKKLAETESSDLINESINNGSEEKLSKKKKKSEKKDNLNESNQNGVNAENSFLSGNDEPNNLSKKERKKLKKLSKSGDSEEICADINESESKRNDCLNEEVSDKCPLGKKEKKRLKNLSKSADEMDVDNGNCENNEVKGETVTELNTNGNEPMETLSRKERKKLKKQAKYATEVMEIENYEKTKLDENYDPNEKTEAIKAGKKRKGEKLEAVDEKKAKLPETDALLEPEDIKKDKSKFFWNEVIIEVLKNRSGNELSLKRLSKKVITEYCQRYGDKNIYDKLLKKFNKKVLSTPGVVVSKDKAKLITEETQ